MRRLVVVLLLVAAGCVGPGLLTDGTTVSLGTHSTGALRAGRRLPFRGEGYIVPRRWQERQRNFGTDELVELLVRSARRVHRLLPGSLLGVADLSPRGGGATPEHRSHRSGRDVDLIYYMTDLEGRPVLPTEMIYFDASGLSVPAKRSSLSTHPEGGGSPGGVGPEGGGSRGGGEEERRGGETPTSSPAPVRRVDIPRTWAMVRTLVTDPQVPVQWIFIGRPIAELLIQHARKSKEPDFVIERALAVMHQPSDAQNHMDHWHLRIFCAPSDRYQGCVDRGPPRWLKKDLKYLDTPHPVAPLPLDLAGLGLERHRLAGL